MTIAADELALLREQTKAFIAADYKWLTMIRRTEVSNDSGGFTFTENPLVFPQQMRLIPQQGNMSPLRDTLDGESVQPDYVLLAEFDANVERFDSFIDQGRRYSVLFVHEKRSYELKAEVKYLGEAS